ncbi:hypothetical protein H8N00_00505 [Streptomyces sp. AC563]|uniref:hypothetical protein n=1 Tax=Streptomyces buecherae TaxID=2763006 RepID=UPI00164D0FFF|nr:hypothetical protein [Streptomyces buecherae]MBC3987417.1 hypothetical protein [Streptomyces buecherae]
MTNGVLDGSKHVPAHPRGTSRTGGGRTGRPPAPDGAPPTRTDSIAGSDRIDGIDGIGCRRQHQTRRRAP